MQMAKTTGPTRYVWAVLAAVVIAAGIAVSVPSDHPAEAASISYDWARVYLVLTKYETALVDDGGAAASGWVAAVPAPWYVKALLWGYTIPMWQYAKWASANGRCMVITVSRFVPTAPPGFSSYQC